MSDPIKDAQKDIKNGKIKIYFEALCYAPVPLGLKMDSRKNWPEYEVVYVSGSCMDFDPQELVKESKDDQENDIIQYGTLYNKEVAKYFGMEIEL